jgi:hypothetical protein
VVLEISLILEALTDQALCAMHQHSNENGFVSPRLVAFMPMEWVDWIYQQVRIYIFIPLFIRSLI